MLRSWLHHARHRSSISTRTTVPMLSSIWCASASIVHVRHMAARAVKAARPAAGGVTADKPGRVTRKKAATNDDNIPVTSAAASSSVATAVVTPVVAATVPAKRASRAAARQSSIDEQAMTATAANDVSSPKKKKQKKKGVTASATSSKKTMSVITSDDTSSLSTNSSVDDAPKKKRVTKKKTVIDNASTSSSSTVSPVAMVAIETLVTPAKRARKSNTVSTETSLDTSSNASSSVASSDTLSSSSSSHVDGNRVSDNDEWMIGVLSREMKVSTAIITSIISLFDDGSTVPFIARYRKEVTNSMHEVAIESIQKRVIQLRALRDRRQTIIDAMMERKQLTPLLRTQLMGADTMTQLEDLYLPYRPKRRTLAVIARDHGLEPLALKLLSQPINSDIHTMATPYIKGDVKDVESALRGARYIISEIISEDSRIRAEMRTLYRNMASFVSTKRRQRATGVSDHDDDDLHAEGDEHDDGKKKKKTKKAAGRDSDMKKDVNPLIYSDYFDRTEARARHVPPHRVLAMLRGRRDGVLSLTVRPSDNDALSLLHRLIIHTAYPSANYITNDGSKQHVRITSVASSVSSSSIISNIAKQKIAKQSVDSSSVTQVVMAIADGYKRSLSASMQTEMFDYLFEQASQQSIGVFATNLRQLLMSSPLGQRNVLAIDPAMRTGCKVVCLDKQGKLVHHTVFSLVKQPRAADVIPQLCIQYNIDAIAIGNGTGGRETETAVRALPLPKSVAIFTVNEAGASVYSASEVARGELPDYDVTVRGAVSIGRRLMDPLSELVKVDPKAIGVGQYQHDVDQKKLRDELDSVVISCVNQVGVSLNTASSSLLSYVSGLSSSLAKAIVATRDTNGAYQSRYQLRDIPRLGPKAFEQAAGFLRITTPDAIHGHPLDASGVHPERYALVERMAKDAKCSIQQLIGVPVAELTVMFDLNRYVDGKVGLPTLHDIIQELSKPGRDPRASLSSHDHTPMFANVHTINDLRVGMHIPGVVNNVAAFGAFVDIGVHQSGMVHSSKIPRSNTSGSSSLSSPVAVVVGQRVMVTVTQVDLPRQRISLSMLDADRPSVPPLPAVDVTPAPAIATSS